MLKVLIFVGIGIGIIWILWALYELVVGKKI